MLLGESQTINIRFWCNNIYTYIFRCEKMTRFFVQMLASSCSGSHTVTGLLLLLLCYLRAVRDDVIVRVLRTRQPSCINSLLPI